jgi:hypothetical protein
MAEQIIAKDTPLAEITLRKYERPKNLKGRDLIRKLCLSIGVLQPGDSRDVIVDILDVLLKKRKGLGSEDIRDEVVKLRKRKKLPMLGIASSNVRRQLRRLRELFIVEKIANNYRIAERAKLIEIFEEKIESFYLDSIVSRVKEYFKAVK